MTFVFAPKLIQHGTSNLQSHEAISIARANSFMVPACNLSHPHISRHWLQTTAASGTIHHENFGQDPVPPLEVLKGKVAPCWPNVPGKRVVEVPGVTTLPNGDGVKADLVRWQQV